MVGKCGDLVNHSGNGVWSSVEQKFTSCGIGGAEQIACHASGDDSFRQSGFKIGFRVRGTVDEMEVEYIEESMVGLLHIKLIHTLVGSI